MHVVCPAREGKGHYGEEDLQAGGGADQQAGRQTLICLGGSEEVSCDSEH